MSQKQRGVTLLGLLFWAVLIGVVALVTLKVLPTLNEYDTIRSAVSKIAKNNPPTVAAARAEFDRQQQIEYSISSLTSKDLQITKEGERVVISFAYDKEIALAGPVFLLIKYEGRSE
jgi:Tfp pilus assembly protein FimT